MYDNGEIGMCRGPCIVLIGAPYLEGVFAGVQVGIACISSGKSHIDPFIELLNAMEIIDLFLSGIFKRAEREFKRVVWWVEMQFFCLGNRQ